MAAMLISGGAANATSLTNPGGTAGGGGGTITGVTAGTGLSGGGTSGNITVNLSTPVSKANGGTGTASPGESAGTGLSVSGSWPTQQFSLSAPVAVANGGTGATSAGAAAANNIGALAESNNLSDLGSPSTARSNLGLAAVAASGSASDLTSGALSGARLGSQSTVAGFYRSIQCTSDSSNSLTANGTKVWTFAGASSEFNNDTPSVIVPVAVTVKNLGCSIGIALGASNSYAIAFKDVTKSSTSLTCTIAGSATSCTDLTDSQSVSASDSVDLTYTATIGGTTPTATNIRCCMEVDF
jgi:hypothetical protein